MNKLIHCLQTLRSKLDALRRQRLKETQTRTNLIDPVLQSLGWDIQNPIAR